jgi:hypothetical protein
MTLFNHSTKWCEWIGTQLAAAEVDEKYDEYVLDKFRALNAIANKTEKTVTAAKARQYEDPDFLAAQEKYHTSYAFRKLNQALYANEERKSALISRELTRRVGRNDRDGRANRWSA